MTLQTFGTERLGRSMAETCRLARLLAARLAARGRFRVKAPVTLNIVCFGLDGAEADRRNRRIVEYLQVAGKAAPSITLLHGEAVIRCALVNHRTTEADIEALLQALDEAADAV
jgi:glutamate/tyrosine decarboxylase-like PLP-dependent enzyme